ncbi:MAG: Rieske 2Fe-2S domain-containing protein [Candidatus Marinimicrobia bacterium]|nr:Rieske 2Fe-2S domain-containing protein [Candidatus Neomarinimicrobiota bacterium]
MPPKITINPNIAQAETLPSDFYLNENIFKESKENIFTPSWQFITDVHRLDNTKVFPFTFLKGFIDEPLVIINKGENINCYSNVCTHRSHLVTNEPCKVNKLRCPYHGRTYNLDGTFNSTPGFENVENFPTEKDNLQSIPTLQWKQFIFASLNPSIDITPVLNDIEMRLPNFPFDELTYDENNSASWEIDAHWALYCENYLEGFHVPFVHQGLAKDIDVGTYETQLLENGVLQIAEGEKEIPILNDPKTLNRKIYGLYYWIFPNIMLNFYSWGLSVNIIEPISKEKTRVRFLSFSINSMSQPQEGDATLERVELEDQSVVQSVQKGIKSRYYKRGRYSPTHEKGVHHFHGLLAKYLP